jgi:hypothetical protein
MVTNPSSPANDGESNLSDLRLLVNIPRELIDRFYQLQVGMEDLRAQFRAEQWAAVDRIFTKYRYPVDIFHQFVLHGLGVLRVPELLVLIPVIDTPGC